MKPKIRSSRPIDDERHDQSLSRRPVSAVIRFERESPRSSATEGDPRPGGPASELGQTIGDALTLLRLLVAVPNKGGSEDLPVLRFRRAPMLGCPDAQSAHQIIIHISNDERRHGEPLCCHSIAETA